jgi:putative tricarboxylic transport membrane protein
MIAGISALVLGVAGIVLGWQLGLGSLTDPGPALWPVAVSFVLVVAGAVIIFRREPAESFTRQALVVVLAAASLAGYAAVIEHVGFEIPTVLLLAGWLRFIGSESWRTTAVVSVVATACAYALFISALGVPLPHLIGV